MFSELTRRLATQPLLAGLAVALSVVIAILGLMPSVYAAQVMGRFTAHGQMGTLVTLSIGLVLAILAEMGLRTLRHRLLEGICLSADDSLSLEILSRTGDAELGPAIGALEMIAGTYSAAKIAAFMDVAAVVLYLVALWLLSPAVGVAVSAAMVAAIAVELVLARIAAVAGAGRDGARGGIFSATRAETVLSAVIHWMDQGAAVARIANVRETAIGAANSAAYAFVLAVGAVMVVDGTLSPGTLFGIGLIASRAIGTALKAAGTLNELKRGQPAMEAVVRFLQSGKGGGT